MTQAQPRPVWNIVPAKASCQVKENQLAPVSMELHPKSDEAILPE